jgi:hypothetical protein
MLMPANARSQSPQLISTGSGFVVSTQGYLITNDHVTQGCESVRVRLGDAWYSAELIASDKQNDLALLKVPAVGASLRFRDSPRVKLGEGVIVLGYPLSGIVASSLNLTTGAVSALAGLGDDARVIQFTAPVQPGNSGGPLLDQSGNIVGVVASKLSPLWTARVVGTLPENVNFAIKSSVVREFLESRGVQYETSKSDVRLETPDIGEGASRAVAFIQCLGSASPQTTFRPNVPEPPSESSGESSPFQRGLNGYQRRDYGAAVKEWRPLAERGDPASQFNLGLMCVDGLGVPQDYSQAVIWFERSAQQDYAKAQLNLGAMYGAGRGVKRDYIQAYKWLSVCAAKGDTKCQSQRDLVATKLSRSQLVTAQHLAGEWKPKMETH